MPAQINITTDNALILINIQGYLDGPASASLQEKLRPILSSSHAHLFLDLSTCPVINSVAIGKLLEIWDDLESVSTMAFHVIGAKPLVKSALTIAGFNTFCVFHDSEREARAHLGG